MVEKTYLVTGMSCEHCVKHVKKAVSEMDVVASVAVDLAAGTMTVRYDEKKIGFDDLKNAVEDAGYGLEEM